MKLVKTLALAAVGSLALAACDNAGGNTRDQVRVVGSSTVFPFAKKVAEDFVQTNTDFPSPLIESTGTGGGMSLFCGGLGVEHPDMVNASRPMKASEFETCQANGVDEVILLQVGMDGLAFATAKNGIDLNLTPDILYRALAASPYGEEQTATRWSDIDSSLPNEPILIYGPPATSGTRDALVELVMERACDENPEMEALKESDEEAHDRICSEVRNDAAYVTQGEQDNLIVQKISNNENAVGIFGYSYLEENTDTLKGLPMNGVDPTYENIASFDYLGARPLFVYVKKAHLDVIPGLREFMNQWVSSWDPDGPLSSIGLISSPEDVRAANAARATDGTVLTAADFE